MNAVVMFAKNPDSEKVKTRLAADIGEAQARAVYKNLIAHIISLHKDQPYHFVLYVSGDDSYFQHFDCRIEHQTPGDLGSRMHAMFVKELKRYQQVVIIGSDCPAISPADIADSFRLLGDVDVVLGPAEDGGYYLVALKEPHTIFSLETWSHEQVLKETHSLIKKYGLSVEFLHPLRDIDTIEDLKYYQRIGVL